MTHAKLATPVASTFEILPTWIRFDLSAVAPGITGVTITGHPTVYSLDAQPAAKAVLDAIGLYKRNLGTAVGTSVAHSTFALPRSAHTVARAVSLAVADLAAVSAVEARWALAPAVAANASAAAIIYARIAVGTTTCRDAAVITPVRARTDTDTILTDAVMAAFAGATALLEAIGPGPPGGTFALEDARAQVYTNTMSRTVVGALRLAVQDCRDNVPTVRSRKAWCTLTTTMDAQPVTVTVGRTVRTQLARFTRPSIDAVTLAINRANTSVGTIVEIRAGRLCVGKLVASLTAPSGSTNAAALLALTVTIAVCTIHVNRTRSRH